MEADLAISQRHRHEVQSNAVRLVFDRDGGSTGAIILWNRIGKFAASQEISFFAAQNREIRLGQDAQKIILPHRCEEDFEGRVAGYEVSELRDVGTGCWNREDGSTGAWSSSNSDGCNLPDDASAEFIAQGIGHAPVHAKSIDGVLGYLGEAHLKHDLLAAANIHEVDRLGR